MSQSQQAMPAPPARSAAPPAVAPESVSSPSTQLGTVAATSAGPAPAGSDTPRQLRLLTTALILVGVILGLVGALSFSGLAYSLNRSGADTAQLIRVQKIQTNLLSADATATNAFLVGGLEPPAQRAAYDTAIAATGSLIAEASDAQPADAEALSVLNQAVVNYAVTIEQARANNRQGFPVGAQYLRNASASLRADALPVLDNLVSANSARAGDEMSSKVGWFFPVVGLLALAALVVSMVWVARRFKRRLNTGLVTATGVVLIAWLGGIIALSSLAGAVNDISSGSFASVNAAANARIEANNAKSNESLTLIARGSGAAFEKAWAASAGEVDASLAQLPQNNLRPLWSAYVTTHRQIRKLDDGGSWDQAVQVATGTVAASSNMKFGQFDTAATDFLNSVSAETSNGLASPQPLLVLLAVLTFVAGIGAALLARWGLAARLKEYR